MPIKFVEFDMDNNFVLVKGSQLPREDIGEDLYYAGRHNDFERLASLIKEKVDINKTNRFGSSALHGATERGLIVTIEEANVL